MVKKMAHLAPFGFFIPVLLVAMYAGHAIGYSVREVYVPCDNSCNNGLCDYACGTCVCYPFYAGEYCDRPLIRPCGNYYCFNEGTCQMDGSGKEHCQCTDGYTGKYCLANDGTCFCLNGGSCVTYANVTTCNCLNGFTGDQCEEEILENEDLCEECGSHSCFNGGTCQSDTCVCAEGFGGIFCQYDCADDNEALQSCGRHFCYYGGVCINNTCHCPTHTSGTYCEYVIAPSTPLTLVVMGHLTSATITWQHLFGYDAISRSGGVLYTVAIENTVTGQQSTVTTSNTSITQTLIHSTEYCFSVRAKVSGGVGEFSESKCYTTPEDGSAMPQNAPLVVSIATLVAVMLVFILLTAVTFFIIWYIWRLKRRVKGRVDEMEMSHAIENLQPVVVAEHDAVAANTRNNYYDVAPNTENIYEEVGDVSELYESMDMDAEVTANPIIRVDQGNVEKCNNSSPNSDIDDVIDVYDHVGTDGGMVDDGDHLGKADIVNRISASYI